MVAQYKFGENYNISVFSEKEINISKAAAQTYEWTGENINLEYPQILLCKKTGNKALKKKKNDIILWDIGGNEILKITADEYIIRDIII
jgi:hypothetical protein